MDTMESKMAEWRRRMPSKRVLTSQLGQFVQQKSVAVLYTQSEQDRIKNVTDLIATATNEFEKGEHWDRILKVVDVLTNTSNKHVLKEAIRYVRLRLGDSSPRVVLLTLTLTEALMKNCNRFVYKEIGSEAFMGAMEALYKEHSCKRGRDSMEIEGRVLELIQTWGEAFMNQKFEFPYFIYMYEKLRKKGVRFPKYDKTNAPLFNGGAAASGPRRAMDSVSSASGSMGNSRKTTVSSELAKLSAKEVFHVATNVAEMFEDMLDEAERDGDDSSDRGVIVELAAQANDLVLRLQTVIQSAADSESEGELSKYLAVNDTLHIAISRYDDLKRGVASKTSGKAAAAGSKAKSSAEPDLFGGWVGGDNNQQDHDDDDGFGDFVRARVGGGEDKKPAATTSNQTEEDDPFASFVAQRSTKTTTTVTAAPVAKNLIDLWGDAPSSPVKSAPAAPVAEAAPAPAKGMVDLWGDDLFLQPTAPTPSTTVAAVPMKQAETSPFDDIWGDLVTPTPSASVPPPTMAMAPHPTPVNTSTANPFDFFDDFSAKTTIAAPVVSHPVPAPAKANPFDFGFPAPPSQAQAPVPTKPAVALNPFDF